MGNLVFPGCGVSYSEGEERCDLFHHPPRPPPPPSRKMGGMGGGGKKLQTMKIT